MAVDWKVKKNDAVLKRIENRAKKSVHKAGKHLVDATKKKVSGQGGGKRYKTAKGSYQASAAGEPPAQQTGNLKKSISMEYKKVGKKHIAVIKVSGVPYAWRLEKGFFGRDSLGRYYNQAPRPFFLSTAMEEMRTVIKILEGGG